MDALHQLRLRIQGANGHRHSRKAAPQNSPGLCTRCQSLQLQKYINTPYTVLVDARGTGYIDVVGLAQGFRVATITDKSISKTCSLCKQFDIFLQHSTLAPYPNALNQSCSLDLWCRQARPEPPTDSRISGGKNGETGKNTNDGR